MFPMQSNPPQFNMNGFMQQLNQLKQQMNGDPMQQIQQMLNSGRVTQQQYNAAVQQAQRIMQFIGR